MREVYPDPGRLKLRWRKALASVGNANCVELARMNKIVAIRDSKNPEGPALFYSREEFSSFVEQAKNDRFKDLR